MINYNHLAIGSQPVVEILSEDPALVSTNRDRLHRHHEASSLALTDPKEASNFGLRQAIGIRIIVPTHTKQIPCFGVSKKVLDQEL